MQDVGENLVRNIINVQLLDRVLIVTDKKKFKIGKMIYDASKKVNLESILMSMEPRTRDGEEPPAAVAAAMKETDIIIALTEFSLTHTKATNEARKNGARIFSLPGIDEFSLTKGGLTADYSVIQKNVEKIFSAVNKAAQIEVESKNGTKIKFSVVGRKWEKDNGIVAPGEVGNLPSGEIYVAPVENSANGKIVFDHFSLSKGKLELNFENGDVREMKGDKEKLQRIFDEVGYKAKIIAEFGIGCNPKSKTIGNTLEDEKVFGTVHFALGKNTDFGGTNEVAFHKDGVIDEPTVTVDRRLIIRNGKWLI
jgi:leucyl aminopeptidase (aminopeptidase T)